MGISISRSKIAIPISSSMILNAHMLFHTKNRQFCHENLLTPPQALPYNDDILIPLLLVVGCWL